MRGRNKGLYADKVIILDKRIPTTAERTCILAEEIGHYYTTVGNIIDQTKLDNRKQERRAREWAHNKLIPLTRIVEAFKANVKGRHEIAEYLGVTEEFLQDCIDRYIDKFGLFVVADKQYTIMFDPLAVIKRFIE